MIQRGKTIRTWAMAIALATNFTIQAQTTLKQGFSTPPDSVSLWCYYYWISDNVSEKGITRDLVITSYCIHYTKLYEPIEGVPQRKRGGIGQISA